MKKLYELAKIDANSSETFLSAAFEFSPLLKLMSRLVELNYKDLKYNNGVNL